MPRYKSHLVGGVAAFGIVAWTFGHYRASMLTLAELLGCALLGSLFPDIDTKSKGQKIFYCMMLILLLYFFIQGRRIPLAMAAIVGTMPLIVRHRGVFH